MGSLSMETDLTGYESTEYRIEHRWIDGSPLRWFVDRKEIHIDGGMDLKNVGVGSSKDEAFQIMRQDQRERLLMDCGDFLDEFVGLPNDDGSGFHRREIVEMVGKARKLLGRLW